MNYCSIGNCDTIGSDAIQSPSSSTTSLETQTSRRHGILRRNDAACDDSSESGNSERRMTVRFVSSTALRHRTPSTSTSRLNRCLKRSFKGKCSSWCQYFSTKKAKTATMLQFMVNDRYQWFCLVFSLHLALCQATKDFGYGYHKYRLSVSF